MRNQELEIKNEKDRAEALIVFAHNIEEKNLKSKAVEEALASTKKITNEFALAKTLAGLAPLLKKGQIVSAINNIARINNYYEQANVIRAFAPRMGGKLISRGLSIVHDFKNEYARSRGLAALIPYTPEALLPQIFCIYDLLSQLLYQDISGTCPTRVGHQWHKSNYLYFL